MGTGDITATRLETGQPQHQWVVDACITRPVYYHHHNEKDYHHKQKAAPEYSYRRIKCAPDVHTVFNHCTIVFILLAKVPAAKRTPHQRQMQLITLQRKFWQILKSTRVVANLQTDDSQNTINYSSDIALDTTM